MTSNWKRTFSILMAAMMIFVVGCSSNSANDQTGNSGGNSSNSSSSDQNSGSNDGSGEIEKIRVSIWERGNAPEGQKITDTMMTRWINEQVKSLGIEVEYVPLPRSEEAEKLNVWMASGSAPDVVLTYSPGNFCKVCIARRAR